MYRERFTDPFGISLTNNHIVFHTSRRCGKEIVVTWRSMGQEKRQVGGLPLDSPQRRQSQHLGEHLPGVLPHPGGGLRRESAGSELKGMTCGKVLAHPRMPYLFKEWVGDRTTRVFGDQLSKTLVGPQHSRHRVNTSPALLQGTGGGPWFQYRRESLISGGETCHPHRRRFKPESAAIRSIFSSNRWASTRSCHWRSVITTTIAPAVRSGKSRP